MTSSPPVGSRNDLFELRYDNNVLIVSDGTGKDKRRSRAIIPTHRANEDIFLLLFHNFVYI